MKNPFLPVLASLVFALPALSQQEGGDENEPAFVKEFTNLPEAKRIEFLKHKEKASVFFGQKRTFESQEQAFAAKKIFANDPGIWNLLGSSYVEFRLFDKASKAFKEAYKLDPRNTGVLFNIAEMEFVTDDWDDSIEKFDELIKKIEKNADGPLEGNTLELYKLAIFKKMLSLYKLGKEEEAVQLAEENWEDFDDTPFTNYSKAALDLFNGKDVEGNEWIASAIRVFGGEGIANWQDTLIEIGLVRSLYGDDDQ